MSRIGLLRSEVQKLVSPFYTKHILSKPPNIQETSQSLLIIGKDEWVLRDMTDLKARKQKTQHDGLATHLAFGSAASVSSRRGPDWLWILVVMTILMGIELWKKLYREESLQEFSNLPQHYGDFFTLESEIQRSERFILSKAEIGNPKHLRYRMRLTRDQGRERPLPPRVGDEASYSASRF